jgi:hypothetical protein
MKAKFMSTRVPLGLFSKVQLDQLVQLALQVLLEQQVRQDLREQKEPPTVTLTVVEQTLFTVELALYWAEMQEVSNGSSNTVKK